MYIDPQRMIFLVVGDAETALGSGPYVSIAAVPHRDELRRGLEILAEIFQGSSDPCVQIL